MILSQNILSQKHWFDQFCIWIIYNEELGFVCAILQRERKDKSKFIDLPIIGQENRNFATQFEISNIFHRLLENFSTLSPNLSPLSPLAPLLSPPLIACGNSRLKYWGILQENLWWGFIQHVLYTFFFQLSFPIVYKMIYKRIEKNHRQIRFGSFMGKSKYVKFPLRSNYSLQSKVIFPKSIDIGQICSIACEQ